MLSVTGCFIPCCVLFSFLLCLVCRILSVTLDVPFRVVYCLASSCVLCVPCCQWLWMFHSLLCFVCLPPMSCVSHVVSDSGCSIPCCVLFAFLLCLVCLMLSVTLDVPFRVVFCLASSCVLCVPCCQWLWMFHSVLCIVWLPPVSCVSHVVSDSGCSIPFCVLFAFLLCLVCPMLSVTLDVPFRVVYCLPSSCVLCVSCCQWLLMFHSVLCFVWLPPVSCVSHVVSDSGCSIPCCVLFGFLLCLVCPMLSVTLDVPFRVVFCLPSSCVLYVPCCQWLWMFHSVLCFICIPPVSCVSHVVSDSGCFIPCCVLFALLLCLVCPMLSVTLDVSFRVVYCLPSSCVLCVPYC
jgi:competence protein ComGC